MERVFTKNVGKKFKAGDIRDYPLATWKAIARDAMAPLKYFSQPVKEAVKEMVKERAAKKKVKGDGFLRRKKKEVK